MTAIRSYNQILNTENLLKSIAGSIAHEIRNPIGVINLSTLSLSSTLEDLEINTKQPKSIIKTQLDNLKKSQISQAIINNNQKIQDHKKAVQQSFMLTNNIIDMILLDMSGRKLDKNNFLHLDAKNELKKAIDLFGFKSKEEKDKVTLECSSSFTFKGVKTAFYYVIFNLIKNALYYINNSHPQAKIKIGTTEDQENNIIYIQDNGPGIKEDNMASIFEPFYSAGKFDGTGLGLSFCKRVMIDFDGDIDCQSSYGKWTRFNLKFPKPKHNELNENQLQANSVNKSAKQKVVSKKILIVDDQHINIIISKKLIEQIIDRNQNSTIINLSIDHANNGQEALSLVKNNVGKDYDLIITDIEMPIMNGIELSNKITKLNKSIPVAIHSTVDAKDVKEQIIKYGITSYLTKEEKCNNKELKKLIYKWIINDHVYPEYNIEIISKSLKNKNILIADDEMINLMVTKKFLEKFGIIVTTAQNGEDLVAKYKEQLSTKDFQDNSYDVIICDINMPKLPGNLAAKKIRELEIINNIKNKAIIIGATGDSDQKKLESFLVDGLDDYFIKGQDSNNLIKSIYYWLENSKKTDEEFSVLTRTLTS